MKPFEPPTLPLTDIRWERLVARLGQANRALAEYNGVLYGVPNPDVLLSPLTTQEAVLSSRIEGTQATFGDVLKFEAGEPAAGESQRLDIQEIINYRTALRHAEHALDTRPLSLDLLLELHAILLDSVRGRDKARGQFRRIQNWIGRPGLPMEQADYVPPSPMRLMEYLDNWEKYYHADDLDPLVQLAIVHAQFEIIHPFIDGNGRIGRILFPLFLYEKHLLDRPMFYLSNYLDEHRDEYIDKLRAIDQSPDAWMDWIEFFLTALDQQARQNATTARSMLDLYGRLKEEIIKLTRSQYAVPFLDAMFEQPFFQSSQLDLRVRPPPSRQALSSIVRTLREAQILHVFREGSGRRAQILALAELVNLSEGREIV